MKVVKACNVSRNTELGLKIRVASSLIQRMIGLQATPSLAPGEGLWIAPCQAIHTWFMRYSIDVLFLDDHGVVLKQLTIKPWRVSAWQPGSRGVLEMAAGTLERTGTRPGDRIELKAAD